jgi:hypothetical protein
MWKSKPFSPGLTRLGSPPRGVAWVSGLSINQESSMTEVTTEQPRPPAYPFATSLDCFLGGTVPPYLKAAVDRLQKSEESAESALRQMRMRKTIQLTYAAMNNYGNEKEGAEAFDLAYLQWINAELVAASAFAALSFALTEWNNKKGKEPC